MVVTSQFSYEGHVDCPQVNKNHACRQEGGFSSRILNVLDYVITGDFRGNWKEWWIVWTCLDNDRVLSIASWSKLRRERSRIENDSSVDWQFWVKVSKDKHCSCRPSCGSMSHAVTFSACSENRISQHSSHRGISDSSWFGCAATGS